MGGVELETVVEVVRRAEAGDQLAWREVVRRYHELVWAVARMYGLGHADAADVSQTTWLRLAEHISKLRDPARLAGWLATTARREALRVLAARRREAPLDLPVTRPVVEERDGPETIAVHADRNTVLWGAFWALPERCQRLLGVLAFAPELSYAQVSRALGMPVGSVGPTRGRCLDDLRRRVVAAGFPKEIAL
jgi:RNA polymerase sigma factor (sigma-70 family)